MPRSLGAPLRATLFTILACSVASPHAQTATPPATGILLLAHGGSPAWNENVRAIAAVVDRTMPVELALGMAARANIQTAIDKLVARRVSKIVAVPLFVSSHSSVITSTAYLLGLRADMPPDLVRFAQMTHTPAANHEPHQAAEARDATKPVRSPVPVSMTPALDAHPIVSAIVASRAGAISRDAGREAVILVAHGPVDDESNERWLVNLRQMAVEVARLGGYRSVDGITVRDDAAAIVRDAAALELRGLLELRAKEARVLVVPVLLSYGGIEEGIRKRLDGLEYVMSPQALAPDDRLADWVIDMARQSGTG